MSSNYQELVAKKLALEKQAAELSEQIESARAAERSGVLSQIKALMTEHGVTLAELGGKGGKRGPKAPKAAGSGKKVAAKYRNTATGDSWSGRGLKPNWLKAALASGRKIEEFAV